MAEVENKAFLFYAPFERTSGEQFEADKKWFGYLHNCYPNSRLIRMFGWESPFIAVYGKDKSGPKAMKSSSLLDAVIAEALKYEDQTQEVQILLRLMQAVATKMENPLKDVPLPEGGLKLNMKAAALQMPPDPIYRAFQQEVNDAIKAFVPDKIRHMKGRS